MATIIKKPSGSWEAQVYVNGKRKTKSFKLKAKAIVWAQETEAGLREDSPDKHTVIDMLEKYRDEVSPGKKGARWERVRLNKFIRMLPFRDKLVTEVTSADVADWRDVALGLKKIDDVRYAGVTRLANGSVRREMVLLSGVFTLARMEWGWVRASPMVDTKKPPSARARKPIWSDAQIEAVCEHLTGPQQIEVVVIFKLAIETAMRSGEMVSLTWDQVDLKRRVIHLEKTKNGDERDVPLSVNAVGLLQTLLPPDCNTGLADRVFTLTDSIRDVLFREARDKAGLKGNLTFHDSRATALTRLSRKIDVLTLAKVSGHRDLKSLMVYYRESAEDIAKRL